MPEFWAYFIGGVGAVVVFLATALLLSLLIYMWNPNNPELKKIEKWSFKWCWEVSNSILATLILTVGGSAFIYLIGALMFTPVINTIASGN